MGALEREHLNSIFEHHMVRLTLTSTCIVIKSAFFLIVPTASMFRWALFYMQILLAFISR
jgi:hypothetical protein